jgi:preprotein translocase subunit SecB
VFNSSGMNYCFVFLQLKILEVNQSIFFIIVLQLEKGIFNLISIRQENLNELLHLLCPISAIPISEP